MSKPHTLPPKRFGDRRPDYVQSACRCAIPVPIQTNEYGNGEPAQYRCTECGNALNGDTKDDPFRRWPGDLLIGAVAEARYHRDEVAILRGYVQQLPLFEQRALRGLSGARWRAAVVAAVRRTTQARRSQQRLQSADLKPARRRAAALTQETR